MNRKFFEVSRTAFLWLLVVGGLFCLAYFVVQKHKEDKAEAARVKVVNAKRQEILRYQHYQFLDLSSATISILEKNWELVKEKYPDRISDQYLGKRHPVMLWHELDQAGPYSRYTTRDICFDALEGIEIVTRAEAILSQMPESTYKEKYNELTEREISKIMAVNARISEMKKELESM